ncbi:MAG: glycosyltransferase family 2 protein [Candidatus Thermoplasmatota archaeon]|jgi:glycosyltransferase involved in cell wall biosynthesis
MYQGRRIAVIIPAYNEELLIQETLDGLPEYVDLAVVVDDASTDSTSEKVREWTDRRKDARVDLVRHETNQGVGNGIKTGYKRAMAAGADILVVAAGDNQMDQAQIPKLLDPIIQGKADYTKGNRLFARGSFEGMSAWRVLGNSILTLLTKVSSGNWHISDPQNGYTAITKDALERINVDAIWGWYGYCNDILARCNAYNVRVKDVAIPARYGTEKSKIKYGRFMRRVSALLLRNFFWRMLVKYIARDFHPLVLFYLLSVPLIIVGVWGGVWFTYDKLANGAPIFLPLSVSILVFGLGMQFLFFAMYFDMNEAKRLNQPQ